MNTKKANLSKGKKRLKLMITEQQLKNLTENLILEEAKNRLSRMHLQYIN